MTRTDCQSSPRTAGQIDNPSADPAGVSQAARVLRRWSVAELVAQAAARAPAASAL